jgi:hypothetical protein
MSMLSVEDFAILLLRANTLKRQFTVIFNSRFN